MVGDGERIAIAAVAELELALEVGAPQVVGGGGARGVPRARWRGPPPRLTRPWRSSTAWMVLRAGTLTSPDSRRTRSSRILRAPQCGFSPLRRTIRVSTCKGTGWRIAPAAASDRSGRQARAPCSGRKSCSQSCAICRTPGTRPSCSRRPAGGRQSAGVPPSPNSLSTASTPPAKWRKVLPMCPVRSVTYLSDRSFGPGNMRSTPENRGRLTT